MAARINSRFDSNDSLWKKSVGSRLGKSLEVCNQPATLGILAVSAITMTITERPIIYLLHANKVRSAEPWGSKRIVP
jgi:hypothetical protein